MAKKNGHTVKVYPSYRHTGQDPIIGVMRQLRADSAMKDVEIKKRSGLSDATAKNWFSGKTRRPQHTTLAAFAGALGMRFVLESANSSKPGIRTRKK